MRFGRLLLFFLVLFLFELLLLLRVLFLQLLSFFLMLLLQLLFLRVVGFFLCQLLTFELLLLLNFLAFLILLRAQLRLLLQVLLFQLCAHRATRRRRAPGGRRHLRRMCRSRSGFMVAFG